MGAELEFRAEGTEWRVWLSPNLVAIAGYTGRDQAAVRHHVEELAARPLALLAAPPDASGGLSG